MKGTSSDHIKSFISSSENISFRKIVFLTNILLTKLLNRVIKLQNKIIKF